MGFVCAFRGRRDSYQVPVALAESEQLDAFVTDHFLGPFEQLAVRGLPSHVGRLIRSRYDERIPQDRIIRLRGTALAELAARAASVAPTWVYALCDPRYGAAAARQARASKSDLFLYSSYAWEAFNASYRHDPRKILFQFHPHIQVEADILGQDASGEVDRELTFRASFDSGAGGITPTRRKSDSSWQRADHIVCASSFTKDSLVAQGADPSRITVIAYGVEIPDSETYDLSEPHEFSALFVGSGLQRKGLHHLLSAWRRANLPLGSTLTVVARVIDPALRPLLQHAKGVRYIGTASQIELDHLYRRATLFVMPSLIEGFGQVYLEALAHGVPVLGTVNTCCPDLGTEDDGVFLTTPGEVDELAATLESLSGRLPADRELRDRARACASRFTWAKFRQGVQKVARAT